MSKQEDSLKFEEILSGIVGENPLGATEFPRDPYGPCWCKSGKKWKFCHRSRHLEKAPSFGQLLALIARSHSDWVENSHVCLHPDASHETCSARVINSHTVQRSGGLSAIAEDNHVLSTKKAFLNIERNEGELIPARVGLKDASTFPGFCAVHDTSMFLPVEKRGASMTQENAFLLSFRALGYEYVMKCYNIASNSVKREYADRGKPFLMQVAVQSMTDANDRGTKMAIADLDRWIKKYSEAYRSGDYCGFSVYAVSFDSVLPFVGAGAIMPEFDLKGSSLQTLGLHVGLEHLTINVTVLEGCTVAVFGWWPESNNAATRFVDSFAEIPDDEKATVLATCIFGNLENTYYRQSWWEQLSATEKQELDGLIRSGIFDRSADSLRSRDIRVDARVSAILDLRPH